MAKKERPAKARRDVKSALRSNNQKRLAAMRRDLLAPAVSASDDEGTLARALFEAGRFSECAVLMARLVTSAPMHVELWRNLILALKNANQKSAAIERCEQALKLFPEDREITRQLGDLYAASDDYASAATAYRRCVKLEPREIELHRLVVAMLRRLDDREAVLAALDDWLECLPGDPVAEHLRAAYAEVTTPLRASSEYVQQVFDQFAVEFDNQLADLHYQVPERVHEHLQNLQLPAQSSLQVLDAGCGTGLIGGTLRSYAARLVGVDLSSGMLARAKATNHYDELHQAELGDYINQHPHEFDLIVVADTLIYFGDLSTVLLAASRALRDQHSWLLFTIEAMQPDQRLQPDDQVSESTALPDYRLRPSGRYCHSQDYVTRTAKLAGFQQVDTSEIILRKEAGRDVRGLLVSARQLAS